MKAINIKWDTDDQVVDLPSEVEIPEGYFEDDIADYLSDEYGWCVFSFELDTDSDKKRYEIYDINDEVMERADDLRDALDYAENNNAKFVMDIQTNEIVWGSDEDDSAEDDNNLTCFEVETIYKSGRKRIETIISKDEDHLWRYYDKHHNKELVQSSTITDAWPY